MKLSAIKYYLSSIPTILTGLSFWKIPLLIFKKPLVVDLKKGLKFYVESPMDVWTIKEVVLDKCYENHIKPNKLRGGVRN